MAFAQHSLGELLQQSKDTTARMAFQTAGEISKDLAVKDPRDIQYLAWMINLMSLAGVTEETSTILAVALYRQALTLAWELVNAEPYNMLNQLMVAGCCSRLTELHLKQQGTDDKGWSREYLIQALSAVRRVLGSEPNNSNISA